MERNLSAWAMSMEPADQDCESDGQQEQSTTSKFPVRRREDVPSSPIILKNNSRLKNGQQPTAGSESSIGKIASTNQPSTGWDTSVVRTSSPIDISAVEEENQAEFKDTPWTIARRLARTNKRKVSNGRPRIRPQFTIKLPPADQPERPRITLQPDSHTLHSHPAFGQTPRRDRAVQPNTKGSPDQPWANQGQPDCPSPHQEELIDPGYQTAYPPKKLFTIPTSDPPPGTLPHSSPPIHYQQREASSYPPGPDRTDEEQLFPPTSQPVSQSEDTQSPWALGDPEEEEPDTWRQASPRWPLLDQFNHTPLPDYPSENGTDYTGIENTTSAIEHLPGFSTPIQEDERFAEDSFDSYYRATGLEEERFDERESYEYDEARYVDCRYDPESSHLAETRGLDNGGYEPDSMDYYPAEEEFGRAMDEEAWDDDAFDYQAGGRGRAGSGRLARYSQGGSTMPELQTDSLPAAEWERDERRRGLGRRPSAKVGTLSRYTRRTPYRAPAYARGSSSARTPAEVYHYKTPGLKPKQTFHETISSFKYQTTRPRPPLPVHHPLPIRPVKLSCVYEPAPADTQDNTSCRYDDDVDDDGDQLVVPTIRSRAIKTSSSRASGSSKPTPRSHPGPRVEPDQSVARHRSMDQRELKRKADGKARAGHPRRPRSRSQTITVMSPQFPRDRPRHPLSTRRETGASVSAGATLRGSPTDEESSGSASVEVLAPAAQTGSSGPTSRRGTDGQRGPRAAGQGRKEAGHRSVESVRDRPRGTSSTSRNPLPLIPPSPPPTRSESRPSKTVFLKYDFDSLSVERCRALREVLEEQVDARRIWWDCPGFASPF
ncbi:hypothetical protein PtB15_13B312 [Puccinia triticina]|nr:hypothetical protein PtB15_13B312 [Puccinia triticina]